MLVNIENKLMPNRIIYELLSQCNYRCTHCFVNHEKRKPSTSEIIHIMSKAINESVPGVVWTGGEPFLRSDLFEIASSLPKKSTFHVLNTNGSLLTKNKLSEVEKYFSLMRLSIVGDKNNYVKNSGVTSSIGYDRIIETVKMILDNNIPLQVNIPAITQDASDIPLIVKDLEKRFGNNLHEVVILPVIKVGAIQKTKLEFPSLEHLETLCSDLREKTTFLLRLLKWEPGKLMLIKSDNLAYAHPVKNVKGGSLLIGSPLTENISDIWNRFPTEFKKSHKLLTSENI